MISAASRISAAGTPQMRAAHSVVQLETVFSSSSKSDGVGAHELTIEDVLLDQLVQDRVQEGEIRAASDRKVDIRLRGGGRRPRIDHDESRAVRSLQAV